MNVIHRLGIGRNRKTKTTTWNSRQSGWLLRLVGLCVASTLTISTIPPYRALAQSTDGVWESPQNLSQSGSATNPAIVVDTDSIVRVLWQDEFANYVTVRFDGTEWSAPQTTSLHVLFGVPGSASASGSADESTYSGPNPVLVASQRPYVFAFWVSPEGKLYSSRVLNRSFTNAAAWTTRKLLSESVADFAASVDARGDLHLGYVRTTDAPGKPAGIYHTRLTKFGLDWTAPVLLYGSPYLRGISGDEANLSMATGGTAELPTVYMAWDNRPLKLVFATESGDGGVSWEKPWEVDAPVPDSGAAGPFNVRVGATGDGAVLIWQSGEPGGACTQLFSYSGEVGASWSAPQLMMDKLPDCARTNEFVAGPVTSPRGLLYLLTHIQSRYVLSAWNGSRWSDPQAQPILSGFENPVNFAQVAYACQRAAWSGERLYVVGCDTAGGDDIWVTSRDVEAAASWFSSSLWSQPLSITNDSLAVTNVELVATGDALVHAFFSQRQDSSIYYTRWDGVAWSRITPVLKLPDGQAGWPAIAAGPRNELYLVARSISGSLYGSRANSHDAVMESAWSTPTLIPIAQEGRASPANVVWDAAGTLHLAYSVPVNEERGVYLIQSSDQGKTWSDPLQVFDGAAEGFDFVGTPDLLASADGSMHILWKRQSVNADGVSLPLSLHYVRTEGASPTVSEATPISDVPAGWREIVVDGKGNLHGLWQSQDMLATLWDRVSSDGGQTWQAAQRLPSEEGAAAVTVDQAGQVHLLGLGLGSLSHWLWDGIRWQAESSQRWSLVEQPTKPPSLLTAAVNTNRNMVAVWVLATDEDEEDATTLLYSTRLLDFAPQQTVVQATPTQTPALPTPTPTTLALEPSATPAPTVERRLTPMPRPTEANSDSIPLAQYAMFVLPVALLTLVVLGIVAFRIIQDRVQ